MRNLRKKKREKVRDQDEEFFEKEFRKIILWEQKFEKEWWNESFDENLGKNFREEELLK